MRQDDIAAELREDNQLISSWLIYYRERKRKVELDRDDILYKTQQPGADRVSSSKISEPTADRACDLEEKTAKAMLWLETVDLTRRTLGPKKILLLDLRQIEAEHPITQGRKGRPGWVIWVQRRWSEEYSKMTGYPVDVCWISDGMIRNMWADIVARCAMIAARRGLLTYKKDQA